MDISSDLLETLKCSKCNRYLSRNPVFVESSGSPVCHRCFEPDLQASRNTPYETVAKLLKFPCKYTNFGCSHTVPFVQEKEEIPHETFCQYRPLVCLVMGSNRCDWLGNKTSLLEHCLSSHPDRVISNPNKMKLNFNKPSESNYLLNDLGQLFRLQIKITGLGGKIYHAVQCLGDAKTSSKYYFILEVYTNSNEISKKGPVTPFSSFSLIESSSVVVNMDSLSDFCGFDGVTFTVSVRSVEEANCASKSGVTKRISKIGSSDKAVKKMIKSDVYQRYPKMSKYHRVEEKKL